MNGPVMSHASVNFQQTDEQLSRGVTEALRASGNLPLREISVIAHEGHVILNGWVPTYYQKQLAQCAAMSVDGVESIKNKVEVF